MGRWHITGTKTMKKTFIAFLLAFPLALFSCTDDETTPDNNGGGNQNFEEDPITYFMSAAQAKAWNGKDTLTVFTEIMDLGFYEDERYPSALSFRKDMGDCKYTINLPFNGNIVRSVTISMECYSNVYTLAALADSVIMYAGQMKRALANIGYHFGIGNYMWTDPDPENEGQYIEDYQHFSTLDEFVQAIRNLDNHYDVDFTASAYGNNGIGTEVHGHYSDFYQELHLSYMKQ